MAFALEFLDDYKDAAIIRELQRIGWQCPGSILSITMFKKLSLRVSVSTVRRRFGSWEAALAKAGLAYRGPMITEKMKTQPRQELSCRSNSRPHLQGDPAMHGSRGGCEAHHRDDVSHRLRFLVFQRDPFSLGVC